MEQKELINYLYIIALGLAVIGLGLLAFNQAMTWFYKSAFLQTPCQLCASLTNNSMASIPSFQSLNLTDSRIIIPK